MPTELETMLKKEMEYKLVAPTCLGCEYAKKVGHGNLATYFCTFSRLKDISVLPGAICKFFEEKEIPF